MLSQVKFVVGRDNLTREEILGLVLKMYFRACGVEYRRRPLGVLVGSSEQELGESSWRQFSMQETEATGWRRRGMSGARDEAEAKGRQP